MMNVLEEKNSPKVSSLEFLNPRKAKAAPEGKGKRNRPAVKKPLKNQPLPEPATGSHDLTGDHGGVLSKPSQSVFPPAAVSFNHPAIPDTIGRGVDASSSKKSNQAFFMRQIERLRATIDAFQKRLADLENENARLKQKNNTQEFKEQGVVEGGAFPHGPREKMTPEFQPFSVQGPLYRDHATGKPVCPRCITESRVSVIMKPCKVYVSAVSECPHCHKKSLTSQDEREPLTIQPPEIGGESHRESGELPEDPE